MKVLSAVFLLLGALSLAGAQDATRIDGRQHPELIPDVAAYRAVLLMHSHFETEEDTARTEQLHNRIGLSPADHQIYDEVLKHLRQQYDSRVGIHDASVDSLSNASIQEMRDEASAVRKSLSALVEPAGTELGARMTTQGVARLGAFVESEKTHMIVGLRSMQ
jgi:hypothetical protein